jgi:hypothetical protein
MYRTIITYKKYIKTISKIIDLLDNPEKTATPKCPEKYVKAYIFFLLSNGLVQI